MDIVIPSPLVISSIVFTTNVATAWYYEQYIFCIIFHFVNNFYYISFQ